MKKIFTFLLALTVSVGTLFAASGKCGENLTWNLTDSVITISGTGDMKNWSYSGLVPWYSNRSSIKSVVIEEGVTSIGDYAFYDCRKINSVAIPTSVTKIGNKVFYQCFSLRSIVIPDGIISIGSNAFGSCISMTSLTLPASVSSIGEQAFWSCYSLKYFHSQATTPPACEDHCFSKLDIPLYVPVGTKAAYQEAKGWKEFSQIKAAIAFGTCGVKDDNLRWALEDDGLLSISGTGAMADWSNSGSVPWSSYKSSITSIMIEEGVSNIGNNAFYACQNVTSVKLSGSIKSIGDLAFYNCKNLTAVEIPSSVTSIGQKVFALCTGLSSIKVEIGNTTYDSRNNCNAIIETATNTLIAGCKSSVIPNGITSIGSNAFWNCADLTSIVIPNSVTSIGANAFYWCKGLTSVTMSKSVTNIGNDAFSTCTALTSIVLPGTVTSIGKLAFSGCTGLTSITCEALTPPECGTGCFNNVDKSIPLYVPTGKETAYHDAPLWGDFTTIQAIPPIASGICGKEGDNLKWTLTYDGILTISGTGEMANWTDHPTNPWYAYMADIQSVVIESGATSIGACAFYQCSNLSSISIPDGVTSIEASAFYKCAALSFVAIPNSVNNIGNAAFRDCSSLSVVTLPESLKTVKVQTFRGCSSLTELTIPAGVTYIRDNAFNGCTGLKSITCEALTPPTCASNCFDYVDKSIPLYVPEGKTAEYQNAYVWSSFKNIKESSVLAFGTCGAEGDNVKWKLSDDGVMTIYGIGPMADYCSADRPWSSYRTSIKSVVIEEGVTYIGGCAFPAHYDLTSLTIPNSVTFIGDRAFGFCNNLTSIYCNAMVPPVCVISFYEVDKTTITLYVPKGAKEAYQNEYIWRDFSDIREELPCQPASGTCGAEGEGDNLTWTLTCDSVLTISGTGAMAGWSNIEEVPWYFFRSSIKSVVIEEGVSTIGMFAFGGYTTLSSVTIPNTVTSIGYGAFAYCSGLTSITCQATTLPDCDYSAFYNVDKTIPVYVPAGITSVPEGWEEFTNFQEICMPVSGTCGAEGDNIKWTLTCEGVLTISGNGAMKDFSYLSEIPWYDNYWYITSIVISEGVTHIGRAAFYSCLAVEAVTIPNSVTSIGNQAFWNCLSLSSVTISNSVTDIGKYVFTYCYGLTAIEVASDNPNYSSVDGVLFNKDKTTLIQYPLGNKRTEYTIPNSVTTIGRYAFAGAAEPQANCALTSVTIPNSVTNIEDMAFDNCPGLTSITCQATTPPTCGTDCFNEVDKSIPLYVPAGTEDAYMAAEGWKDFSYLSGPCFKPTSGTCGAEGNNLTWTLTCEGLLTISGNGAMMDYSNDYPSWDPYRSAIKSVVIENGVTSIGVFAFFNCKGITSVTIPNSVTRIGEGAFEYCSGLTSIGIPNGVTELEKYVFRGCSALTSVTIPEGVTKIGQTAFDYCTSLTSVTIPESVTAIGIDAFSFCSSLTSITIPENVTWISHNAFARCKGLTEITCYATTPPECGENPFIYVNTSSITLYVPKGTKEAYQNAEVWKEFNIQEMEAAPDDVKYQLVDLSTETLTAGQYIIVFDDNKAHGAVSGKDLIASSDELTFKANTAYVPKEAVCAVTIAPLGTDSFSILLADGKTYMDLQAKNSVTTSEAASGFAISDGGDQNVKIAKYLASESKTYIMQHNTTGGNFFRMYSSTNYTLPKLYRNMTPPTRYQIRFLNEDGTVLQKSSLTSGETPVYEGKTPVKESTAQYTYTFKEWTPAITAASEDKDYTAVFESTLRSYTITFKDENGKTLDSRLWDYGTTPTCEEPSKQSTPQYTYTFKGWVPAITSVTGNATYTATYNSTINQYSVTFIVGPVKSSVTVEYGTSMSALMVGLWAKAQAEYGFTQNAQGDYQYSDGINIYTFTGWDKELPAMVTEDATYTAVYDETVKEFTVTFMNEDGVTPLKVIDLQCGTDLSDPEILAALEAQMTLVKDATPQYTYTFKGWTPAPAVVTGNATYTAVFEATLRSYTVTWVNWDGAELAQETYAYGATPEYKGATPTRPATAQNTFTFTGWSPAVSAVTGNATYKAQYSATGQTYTVTWKMDDGSVLAQETYAYGDMPSYTDPVKEATAQYSYTFKGWTPEITAVTGNATYTAVFEATLRSYTVTFIGQDGKVLKTEDVEYDKSATAPEAPAVEGYHFIGWDTDFSQVTKDLTVKALYEKDIDYTPQNLKVVLEEKDGDTQITLSWDKVDGAASYDLKLFNGEEEIGALNTFGLNIIVLKLSEVVNLYNIQPGTYTINWSVRSTDDKNVVISEWAKGDSFEITIQGTGTGLDQVQRDDVPCTKVLENGVLYIMYKGTKYNAQGKKLK